LHHNPRKMEAHAETPTLRRRVQASAKSRMNES
jgi:hypothetical protein